MRVSADDRREQLIDATIDVMRCTGVQSLTLRAIAKEAGASLAAVHYCFRSKEELIDAAIERWLANMLGYASQIAIDRGIRAAITSFAQAYWAELVQTPDDVLAQIELVVWAARQDTARELGSLIYPGYADELGAVFEKALAASGEQMALTSTQLTRALLAIIDGCSLQYISQPESDDHEQLFSFLIESLLDRLRISPVADAP